MSENTKLFPNLPGSNPTPAVAAAPAATQAPVAPVVDDEEDDIQKPDELTVLKQRATLMGIKFSNNIGLEALRAKVNAAAEGQPKEDEQEPEAPVAQVQASSEPHKETAQEQAQAVLAQKAETPVTLRQKIRAEQLKLVRCRITNLDPKKNTLPGEIFTVANEFLGTVSKYVPYGEQTDEGYHLPYCLYVALTERTFVSIKVKKVKDKPGQTYVETQDAREFAIEILEQLTPEQLANLAAAQAAAGGLS